MKMTFGILAWLDGVATTAAILAAGAIAGRSAARMESGGAAQSNAATKAATEISGFYCNLKAMSAKERLHHLELTTKLTLAREEVKELADGYEFRLSSDGVSVAEVGEWVAAERKCCPFFDFEIEAERDNGALWLKLRGREGVKAFIRSEFRLAQ